MPATHHVEDVTEFEEIAEGECWRLLASQPTGRVAVISGHYPLVFPVNHTVAARGILFKTAPGTKLWAIDRTNVSFEVDDVDATTHTGWSVLVKGSARELIPERNPELAEEFRVKSPEPWAPGARQRLVRIVVDTISGRRIRLMPAPDPEPSA